MSPEADDERVKLGEKLREAREYLALSQDEVGKTLGLPRTAISMIESGQRRVDALELKRLAEVYRKPVSHFTGDDPTSAPLPKDVEHLARAASGLSEQDREELARFADYLKARAAAAWWK
ncbi:MAG: helix-turn-helix domain-containing protein [Ignavibacteriales bacterium]